MPSTVVFAGKGSSHSWTWIADFLERIGDHDARFLETEEFVDSLRKGCEIAIISGGDGHAIAESLRGPGFRQLKEFISDGGQYVGICAGAYLPLPSSIEPFNEFNLSTTRIENIDCAEGRKDDEIPRVSVRYGACSIIHPVRGEVNVSEGDGEIMAPLYGGPIFKEPSVDNVLLRYRGFGEGAVFQVDQGRAEAMVLGKPAAVRCAYGDGHLLLLGPHLEHPMYPDANRLLQNLLGIRPNGARGNKETGKAPAELARFLADLKVAATGLEGQSFLVGRKLWDASRFLELVMAIEKRAWHIGPADVAKVCSDLDKARRIILRTRVGIESDVDEATVLLVGVARYCVDSHFRLMVEGR